MPCHLPPLRWLGRSFNAEYRQIESNGLKPKATFADEWVWYETNEASGRDVLKWGVAQLATVVVPLAFLRPASWSAENLDGAGVTYLGINLGVIVVGLTIVLMIGQAAKPLTQCPASFRVKFPKLAVAKSIIPRQRR